MLGAIFVAVLFLQLLRFMTFSEDNISKQIDTENPSWEFIRNSLTKIDPTLKSYFILSDNLTYYVQCAGSKTRLTVEYRKLLGETFKHFILGNKINEKLEEKKWDQIDCKVGPIQVYDTEVLTISDAENIFKSFYEKGDKPQHYSYRDVTEQF
ncbi:MAG: hypothetical protein IPP48_01735 [Chitinophagaceae bacterium]|nr:hypothetical protein [Chitinophagaceae bacterium]